MVRLALEPFVILTLILRRTRTAKSFSLRRADFPPETVGGFHRPLRPDIGLLF